MVLKLHALRRTAANRIDVVARLSVRTTGACRLFPSYSLPYFGAPQPFARRRAGPEQQSPLRLRKTCKRTPTLCLSSQQKPPPESFATTAYFGVNAFGFVDASGRRPHCDIELFRKRVKSISMLQSRRQGAQLPHGRDRSACRQGPRQLAICRSRSCSIRVSPNGSWSREDHLQSTARCRPGTRSRPPSTC